MHETQKNIEMNVGVARIYIKIHRTICCSKSNHRHEYREIYSTISDKIINSVRRKAVPSHGTDLFHGMRCMLSVVQCFLDNTYK